MGEFLALSVGLESLVLGTLFTGNHPYAHDWNTIYL